MTNKTVFFKTEQFHMDGSEKIEDKIGNSSLYLNENILFSDIDETVSPNKSKSIDIDLTQQNTFYIHLPDPYLNPYSFIDVFEITLNPISETGCSVNFSVELSTLSEKIFKQSGGFEFKINDTVITQLTNNTVYDQNTVQSNSTINWNTSDKLSFYINYDVSKILDNLLPTVEFQNSSKRFHHKLELSLS